MGVTLLVAALLCQAPNAAGAGSVVGAVEVRLPAGADEKLFDRVTTLITVRRGQTLSRRAVQRSIENLWATGRFADVVALVEEVEGQVSLTFELVPRRVVTEVYVEGSVALTSAEVLAAGKLEQGAEYWPERAQLAAERVAQAYRRKGFQEVRVEPRVDEAEEGVWVGLLITEGLPTRISGFSVVGDPGLPLSQTIEVVGLKLGEVLDATRLEEGIDALRGRLRKEAFYRAKVDPPHVEPGGKVVLSVTAGPRYQLAFRGNLHVTDRSLKAVLGYDGDELLDSVLADRLAARLARFYRFHGFHDVRVVATERLDRDHTQAILTFSIQEGAPLRVVEIAFDGASSVSPAELRDVLTAVMEGSAPATGLEVRPVGDPLGLEGRMSEPFAAELPAPAWHTVLDEDAWVDAAKAMAALYRSRGFLKASVQLGHVELRGSEARARFQIEEGPQAHFRLLRTTGFPAGFRAEAVDQVNVDAPFSPDALERIRQGVLRELGRKGYLFASATATFTLDASGRFADPLVAVEAGPEVRVRAVLPVGNVRTNDDVVLRQATMVEGAPLDADALVKTQGNLVGLGAFRTVEVQMLSPERAEPLKTVLLKVKERPPVSGEFGLGYFLADGPRIAFDLDAPNLGGRAINLAAHGQINWFALSTPAATGDVNVSDLAPWEQLGGRGSLSVQSRSLLPANLGLRFDVGGERVFRPQFRFNRLAAGPTLDWYATFDVRGVDWLRPKFWLALQYEVEWSRVTSNGVDLAVLPTNLADQERLRFRLGTFALQTIRFSPTLDLRDNALNPRRGLLLQGSAEVTGALFAEDEQQQQVAVNFLKASGLASVYVPLGPSVVVALSARGGRIVALTPGSSTPPVKRFFLGGATSMRGFNEDQLIAEDLRRQYRTERDQCQVLVVKDGCTSAARALGLGRQVPSQGGEVFAVLKAEVRFPVFGSLDLGVFFEAGNLWLAAPTSFGPFRTVAGGGVRYVTPIGPLALDLGVNLAPDASINEPAFVVHFNIGVF